MGHKIRLEVSGFKDFFVEIKEASVLADDYYSQCWCIELRVFWQTIAMNGWGFLSKRWGELLFEKIPDCPPPHFISGVPIETENGNDMLWEFADDIGADPRDLAVAIFKTLDNVVFIMPHLQIISDEFMLKYAIGYRHNTEIHNI